MEISVPCTVQGHPLVDPDVWQAGGNTLFGERRTVLAQIARGDRGDTPIQLARARGMTFRQFKHVLTFDSQRAIKDFEDAVSQGDDVRRWRIEVEMERIAFADIRKLLNDDGTPKPISQWSDDEAAAVSGVDHQTSFDGSSTKVKLYDKQRALEKLGQYYGKEKSGLDRMADSLEALMARTAAAEREARTIDVNKKLGD